MSRSVSGGPTCPVAELERRFYAFVLDRLLAWGLVGAAGALTWAATRDEVLSLGVGVVMLVLVWLALAMLTGLGGRTPGKSVLGLRVVHHGSGTPIGPGPALLRALVLGVGSLPTFGIGLATLAWTAVEDRARQRRGWHDLVAHSIVVDVRPVDDRVEEVDHTPRHVVNLTAMRLIPATPVEPEAPLRRASPPRSEQSARHVQDSTLVPAHAPATPPRPASPGAVTTSAGRPVPEGGRTVVRPKPGAAQASASSTAPRWRVVFDSGETLVVEGLALVGRRPVPRQGEQVHHLVPLGSSDMSVSKTHAQLGPAPDGVLVVMDRGSTNGSVLRRRGVARRLSPGRPATLVEGDVVSFGDRQMTVQREG
ncbi:RDD family protein [Nocardioides piscis]|uniref:FHA domain-containing protein n=1 Tax=Nocardioides piscis TaxID=2714938 RepID=A0A6G7YFH3_9ACTN|nr:RDD family protein [Nocardioides piscis]QIK75357.1 FHA domain-containing protein [Nocardioides piscis]